MTYLIDAWLDHPKPYLRVLDRATGSVCVRLEGEELNELREQGELDPAVLTTDRPGELKELVRTLFLFSYARALRA